MIVKDVRPNSTDPIVTPPHRLGLGTILLRFIVLLTVAVAVLAFAWIR